MLKIFIITIILIFITYIYNKSCIKSRFLGYMNIKMAQVNVKEANKKSLGIVIAHYNENLQWIKYLVSEYRKQDFLTINVYIYSKGKKCKHIGSVHNIRHFKLKNVGRESHTYLYHMIQNYEKLDDITLFITGSFWRRMRHSRLHDMLSFKTRLLMKQLGHVVDAGFFAPQPYLSGLLQNIHVMYVNYAHSYTSRGNSVNQSIGQKIRNINEFIEKFGLTEPEIYTMNGMFAVSKTNIRLKKKSMYIKMIKLLDYHSNPREGFFMELLWGAILDPTWNSSSKTLTFEVNNVV